MLSGRLNPFILSAFVYLTCQSLHAFQFSLNQTYAEQKKYTQVLGLSTAMKMTTKPFSLGGYQGLEVGLQGEVVSTEDLSKLRPSENLSREFAYSLLSFGKGVFRNLDLFFQTTLFIESYKYSNQGVMGRWTFYEFERWPVYMTLVTSINTVNFDNQLILNNISNSLLLSYYVESITIYFGYGLIRSIGLFSPLVIVAGNSDKVVTSDSFYQAGVQIERNNKFLAFELAQAYSSTLSAKLGMRF